MSEEKYPNNVYVKFGKVPLGHFGSKTIKIQNITNVNSEFCVERDLTTNPLDYVFYMNHSSEIIHPKEYFNLTIKYKPNLPFKHDFDYFYITINKSLTITLIISGESLGPNLKCSQEYKVIICKTNQEEFQYLDFYNDAETEAYFNFNLYNHDNFRIEPEFGYLEPFQKKIFKIFYRPTFVGVMLFHLICFIKYQLPIYINLIGVYKPTMNFQKIILKNLSKPESEGTCIKRSYSKKKLILIVPRNIDFGNLNLEKKKKQFLVHNFSLINHSNINFVIEWFKDEFNNFEIQPLKAQLLKYQSVGFQAIFKPEKENSVFSKEIQGQAYWMTPFTQVKNCIEIALPFHLSINLIGNTFNQVGWGWVPGYLLDNKDIVFPATIPGINAITTFIIYKKNNLPILYRFISPELSYIQVYPSQGIITGPYQIFIATLNTLSSDMTMYHEEWQILFNDSTLLNHPIIFRGFAESPKLIISNNDEVHFPITFAGTISTLIIPVKNITRHEILFHYDYSKYSSLLQICIKEDVIMPNQVLFQKWQFNPSEIRTYSFKIRCYLNPLKTKLCKYKYHRSFLVTIFGEASTSELVAVPTHLDFGDCPILNNKEVNVDLIKSSFFTLFNFGHLTITYKLWITKRMDDFNNTSPELKSDIHLDQRHGTLNPREHHRINVKIYPLKRQLGQYAIFYQTCIDSDAKELNDFQKPVRILTIDFNAAYETIQILDLHFIDNTPLFNKMDLWEMMNINEINLALRTIERHSKKEVEIRVPESCLSDQVFNVYFLVKNIFSFESKWNIKRIKICDCPLTAKDKSLTKRAWIYECPHRPLFTFSPKNCFLKGMKSMILLAEINFSLNGKSTLKYLFELSNHREVDLNIVIKCFPPEYGTISLTKVFDMGQVAINQHRNKYFVFWLYNNSKESSTYNLSCLCLNKLNSINFNEEILQCLNPCGTVNGFSKFPVIFKFIPFELKEYQAEIVCTFEKKEINFIIRGEGDFYTKHIIPSKIQYIPKKPKINEEFNKIILSNDYITFDHSSLHNRRERIFFLENTTDHLFYFEWARIKIDNVLMVRVIPSKDLIYPKESKVMKCIVYTLNYPTTLQMNIPCRLLDMFLRKKHIVSLNMHKVMEERAKSEFTITEDGYVVQKNHYPISPNPLYKYINLGLNFSSLCEHEIKETLSLKEILKITPCNELNKIQKGHKIKMTNENILKKILNHMVWYE